jgi:hypothetical protein
VVLVARNFIIVQSTNGSLHLWRTSGNTRFTNATTLTSTNALTANLTAAQQAMGGFMVPAVNTVANLGMVNSFIAPAATRTITVAIAGSNVTVSVTITANNTAMINTTRGTFTTRLVQNLLLQQQSAIARGQLATGDIAVVAGVRNGPFLSARQLVFTAAQATAGQALNFGTGTRTTEGTLSGSHS